MARKPPARLRIALTGGIASGKSTVAALFAQLGIPIIDTDQVARDVVAPGSALLARVVERFGADILREDGALDRARLRSLVFADAAARADLEGLLHPAIRAETDALAARARGPYLIVVIPLLAERGSRAGYGRVLLVDCEEERQLRRLQVRDGATLAEARAILQAQATRAARRALADDVIVNDGDVGSLAARVETLHFEYRALAERA